MNPVRRIIGELIGASKRFTIRFHQAGRYRPTKDAQRADYAFWAKAVRAKATGLELSGLFLKPLSSKLTSWALGMGAKFEHPHKHTEEKIKEWIDRQWPRVMQAAETAGQIGDCFLIVNADLSLSVVSPDVVEPIQDPNDYSRVIGWRIVESYPRLESDYSKNSLGPQRQTFVDEYYTDSRVRQVYYDGSLQRTERYKNQTGRLPVIHIPNNPSPDELYGNPDGVALVDALHAYGEILDAAMDGNVRQGRSVPVVSKLGSANEVQRFWERYGRTETQELPDGTTETYEVLDLDADNVITLGGEAEFDYVSPRSFMGDVQTLLSILFYLILQHTEIPEFIWGAAIPSSRASADTQMGPFVRLIDARRGQYRQWIRELLGVVTSMMRLQDRQVRTTDDVKIKFAALTEKDGRLSKEVVEFAYGRHLIDRATALSLLPVDVENPEEVLRKAQKEADEDLKRAEETAMRQSMFANAMKTGNEPGKPPSLPKDSESPRQPADERKDVNKRATPAA